MNSREWKVKSGRKGRRKGEGKKECGKGSERGDAAENIWITLCVVYGRAHKMMCHWSWGGTTEIWWSKAHPSTHLDQSMGTKCGSIYAIKTHLFQLHSDLFVNCYACLCLLSDLINIQLQSFIQRDRRTVGCVV